MDGKAQVPWKLEVGGDTDAVLQATLTLTLQFLLATCSRSEARRIVEGAIASAETNPDPRSAAILRQIIAIPLLQIPEETA